MSSVLIAVQRDRIVQAKMGLAIPGITDWAHDMILRPKDKKHAEAIIKHCVKNGMDEQVANLAFWNHLVRLFKKFELIELERNELRSRRCDCKYFKDAFCLKGYNLGECPERRTSCAKGESPAQNTMEICHTAPNNASPKAAQISMELEL